MKPALFQIVLVAAWLLFSAGYTVCKAQPKNLNFDFSAGRESASFIVESNEQIMLVARGSDTLFLQTKVIYDTLTISTYRWVDCPVLNLSTNALTSGQLIVAAGTYCLVPYMACSAEYRWRTAYRSTAKSYSQMIRQ